MTRRSLINGDARTRPGVGVVAPRIRVGTEGVWQQYTTRLHRVRVQPEAKPEWVVDHGVATPS